MNQLAESESEKLEGQILAVWGFSEFFLANMESESSPWWHRFGQFTLSTWYLYDSFTTLPSALCGQNHSIQFVKRRRHSRGTLTECFHFPLVVQFFPTVSPVVEVAPVPHRRPSGKVVKETRKWWFDIALIMSLFRSLFLAPSIVLVILLCIHAFTSTTCAGSSSVCCFSSIRSLCWWCLSQLTALGIVAY